MLYADYLKTVTACPFCDRPDRVLAEAGGCYLTYCLAPYSPDHMLVVPKRHATSFLELTPEERDGRDELLGRGARVLRSLGHENFTVIAREGANAAKSVEHLHYHLVPNVAIGDLDHAGRQRRVLEAAEVEAAKAQILAHL